MNYALFEFLDVNKARKVLLGLLGGGVRAQSAPNPDPISNQNKSFSHRFHTWPLKSISVFRSTPLRNDIIITYTTTSKKKKILESHFEFAYFSFFYTHWNWNDTCKCVDSLPYFSRKLYPIPDQNGQSLYPFSDQNGEKPYSLGQHISTNMADIREYPLENKVYEFVIHLFAA